MDDHPDLTLRPRLGEQLRRDPGFGGRFGGVAGTQHQDHGSDEAPATAQTDSVTAGNEQLPALLVRVHRGSERPDLVGGEDGWTSDRYHRTSVVEQATFTVKKSAVGKTVAQAMAR